MKRLLIISAILFIPLILSAQFEQKLSFNLSAGMFKTFGTTTYIPHWSTSPDEIEPFQMPHYRPGVYINGSFQINLNRYLSIQSEVAYMYSGSWYYDMYEGVNYLHFAIHDTITEEILEEGENKLDLSNLSVGLVPKIYILPGKRFNPFLYVGFSVNFTKANFTNNDWLAEKELGMLDPDDTVPWNDFFQKNTGWGVNPGMGLKYNLNETIGFNLSVGYYFISLDPKNFKYPEQEENFNAIIVSAGISFSFLKSKKL